MKKNISNILILILISILIEIFFFNFGFFRTFLSSEKSQTVKFSTQKIEDSTIITVKDINSRITSLNIKFKNVEDTFHTYTLKYLTDGFSDLIELSPKTMTEKSTYFLLDTQVNCSAFEILTNNENVENIDSIIINEPIFTLSVLRLFITFCIVLFIFMISNKNIFKINYNPNSKKQFLFGLVFIAILFLLINFYTEIQNVFYHLSVKKSLLVYEPALHAEAFINNKGILKIEPSEELKSMENPYDFAMREKENVEYLYDTAYYDGNYYSYFGIAPILTTVLPLKLLTGTYFSSVIYNLIYIAAICFLTFLVYRKLVSRYLKKNVSLFLFYLGYIAILLSSNILTLLRGLKYDLVITSGICFFLLALYCILSLDEKKKSYLPKLIIAGLSTGLIVLSKPTFILYYPILFFFLVPIFLKSEKKQKIKMLLAFGIPLALLAIFQMYYNLIRFDSIFEFGAKYQLTSYNMENCMSFTIGKSIAGILKYIFTLPLFNIFEFPFVQVENGIHLTSFNELCYQNRLIGLIAIPLIWILLFQKQILKDKKNSSTKELSWLVKLTVGIILINMVISSSMGGICETYAIDMKFILSLVSLIVWMKFLSEDSNEIKRKVFLTLWIITVCIYIPIGFSGELNWLANQDLEFTLLLKNIFEFWK